MQEKKDFWDLILILIKHKKKLYISFFTVAVVSLIISLLLPKWYKSTATIIIPEAGAGPMIDMSTILGGVPLDFGSPMSAALARMNTIFDSRTFLDDVIEKFDLQEEYGNKYRFETREELQDHINFEQGEEDQTITISFEYKGSPEKAQEICNYMLQKANELYIKLETEEAHNNRIFIERLYLDANDRLQALEDSLKDFQKKYGTYLLDAQLEATIQNQAIEEQKLTEAKIQYEMLSHIMNKNAAQLKELQIQINTIENILKKAQTQVPDYSVTLPLKGIPDKAVEYYRYEREIEILAKVLEFLTPQYENAKIKENQSKPSFIILDQPDLPEYKSRPKRAFVVLGTTAVAMLLVIIYVYIIETLGTIKSKTPDKYLKIKNVLAFFRIKID